MNDLVAFLSLLVGVVIVIAILLLRLRAGEQVRSRLTYSEEEQEALAEVRTDPATGWLSGWLYLAGFRASRAATTFCVHIHPSIGSRNQWAQILRLAERS